MMTDCPEGSKALERVKPLCMQLVHAPTTDLVHEIVEHIKVMDSKVTQQLQPFLLFPLRTTLVTCITKALPQQLLIDTCGAVQVLLGKSQLQQSPVFMDLLSLLSDCCLTHIAGLQTRILSEEERVASLQTMCSLLNNCHMQVLHELFLPTNIVRLGAVVSQLVGVVSDTGASRNLRGQAMSTLLVLLQTRTYTEGDSSWQHGSRFAGLLPGISTAMMKVLLGDSKQGQKLFCKALEVWTEVVCLTLADESLALEQKAGYAWLDTLQLEEQLKSLLVRRDGEWVKGVVARVEWMVGKVGQLKKTDHWKVRQQLVTWATRLLFNCRRSLQSCVSSLLEVVVLLVMDDYVQVAAPARVALDTFRSQCSLDDGRRLTDILKEDLFSLLTSLPRRIKMEDEEEKRAVVGLMVSYITLIGQDLRTILLSQSHVKRLIRVLVMALEMDVTDLKILEQQGLGTRTLRSMEGAGHTLHQYRSMVPRKVFVHFREDRVKADLLQVCRLLGQWGNIWVVVDSVLELFRESVVHRLPCVLILNEMLTGCATAAQSEHSTKQVVRLLLEEYLSTTNMTLCHTAISQPPPPSSASSSLPLSSSEVSLAVVSREGVEDGDRGWVLKKNRAVMLTCLLLEGVAVCAKVLGEGFCGLLTDALYPVMEKVGSELSAISGTAYLTLCDMASACNYRSITELIESNADYLVTCISVRLWRFERHPTAASVLSVILQLCDNNILPLYQETFMQILDVLDERHTDEAMTFLPVLHNLTLAIHRWFPPQLSSMPKPPSCPRLDPSDLVQHLKERQQLLLDAASFHDDPQPDDSDTMQEYFAREEERRKKREAGEWEEEEEKETEEEEVVKEPPLHVKVVKEVLLRAQHLVTTSDPHLTLLALEVIGQGCVDLTDHQNYWLPLVHQLWPSFKKRFHDSEKLVVIKAVKVLEQLCCCCGDFIRQRVEKDVLPSVKHFLHTQARTSARTGRSYLYTVNYKLQLTLLTTLGSMAQQMELDGLALDAVVQCCLPYLSQRQPAQLQQACVHSVRQMASCDADVVWLSLCELYIPCLLTPPSSHCKPFTFKNVGVHNEYSTNVAELLKHLDSSALTDEAL